MNTCPKCSADIDACKKTLDRFLSCEEIEYLSYCKNCGGLLHIEHDIEDDNLTCRKCYACSRLHTLEGDLVIPQSVPELKIDDGSHESGILRPGDKGRDTPYKPPETWMKGGSHA